MLRTIDGFHQDDEGDWVAELSCLHSQHVRHRPPFQDRPWVTTAAGREERIGAGIDCPLCDRCELPPDLEVVRTAGPFDQASLPAALTRDHRVAARTWAVVRVVDGTVACSIATDPPLLRDLRSGATQAIPPEVAHSLSVDGPCVVAIDFLARPRP